MFQLSYTLTRDDFRNLGHFVTKRMKSRGQGGPLFAWATPTYRWSVIAIIVCLGLTMFATTQATAYGWVEDAGYINLALIVGFFLGVMLMALVAMGGRFELVREGGPLTGSVRIVANDDGVTIHLLTVQMQYRWEAVETVSEETDYIVLWLEPCLAELIPHRAFRSLEQRTAFRDFVSARLASSRGTTGLS